jgi:hypothetical protein
VTLRTNIRWLDRDIADLDTAYLHVPLRQLRHRLLSAATTAIARQGPVSLLAFAGPDGMYSFDPDDVFPVLAERLPADLRQDRIEVRTLDSATAVTDRAWDEIGPEETLIIDEPTNLRSGRLGEQALKRLRKELRDRQVLVLDSDPPYRGLADRMDAILGLRWDNGGPIKDIRKHPHRTSRTVPVSLGDHQKTLDEFAEATTV